jgi:hypothetical protein
VLGFRQLGEIPRQWLRYAINPYELECGAAKREQESLFRRLHTQTNKFNPINIAGVSGKDRWQSGDYRSQDFVGMLPPSVKIRSASTLNLQCAPTGCGDVREARRKTTFSGWRVRYSVPVALQIKFFDFNASGVGP